MRSAEWSLTDLYAQLGQALGPSGWWPADSKYEILVGAVLVQNTNWANVDRSLANLRETTGFAPDQLAALTQADWVPLIRPSGFYQNKSRALVGLFAWLAHWDFDLAFIGGFPPATLRAQLLALRGIGQETADAARLFVFDQPTFVADAYARRLFGFLGRPYATYQALAKVTQAVAGWSLHDAQEFHGLIDNFGKTVKTPADFAASPLAGGRLTPLRAPLA
ncbi:endonuclease III domain-containing protein [Lacticaseibacillus parakribbianus]|uniref:endonuclease III domain-containing protein n=1 Tax=Lacticaseibacillus parakribbianus TaxID=2970927 RepID=UPI0021CB1947|nr:deoxyribonuclease I [Lacticaseibacillus parakribbianus]